MKKTVLTYGLISGAICTLLMEVNMQLSDKIGFDKAEYLGYTFLVLSFLLVYFGIRSYRENVANGQITFTKAFAVGISITLIACIIYVLTWELIFIRFYPDFMDKYSACMIEKARAAGASAAAIQVQIEQINKFKEMYKNPLINAAMTFIEPFPVGLGITLLSAFVLRKKSKSQPA